MGITYKPGVSGEPTAAIQHAISVAASAYGAHGVELVVTSLRDGRHMQGSLHYSGNAVDLRRWDIDAKQVTSQVVAQIRSQLGSDYDVILESDHIHIEFDPKGKQVGSPQDASPGSTTPTTTTTISNAVWIFLALGLLLLIKR